MELLRHIATELNVLKKYQTVSAKWLHYLTPTIYAIGISFFSHPCQHLLLSSSHPMDKIVIFHFCLQWSSFWFIWGRAGRVKGQKQRERILSQFDPENMNWGKIKSQRFKLLNHHTPWACFHTPISHSYIFGSLFFFFFIYLTNLYTQYGGHTEPWD